MTKQLLTALLIAGLSATVQAEQWLCKGKETANFEPYLEDSRISSVSFVVDIDREQESVKLKGDIKGGSINDPTYWGGSVVFGDGYIFRASTWSQTIRLNEDGKMMRTMLLAGSPTALVTFAKCKQI